MDGKGELMARLLELEAELAEKVRVQGIARCAVDRANGERLAVELQIQCCERELELLESIEARETGKGR